MRQLAQRLGVCSGIKAHLLPAKARFGGLFLGEAMLCDEAIDRRDLIPADLGRIQYMFDDDQLRDMLEAAQHVPGIWQVAIDNPCLAWMLSRHECFVPDILSAVALAQAGGNPHWEALHERLGFRRRALLGWLGWPAEKWCVRLVSKVVMDSLTLDDLLSLREACTEGTLPKGVLHLPEINAQVVRVATDPELAWVVKYSFLDDLLGVVPEDAPVDEMLRYCLAVNRIKNADSTFRFSDVTQLEAHYFCAIYEESRYLRERRLLREYSREEFPDPIVRIPVYSQPPGIRLERFHSVRDLYQWAQEQGNCLFSYIHRFFSGEVFLLKLLQPTKGTISLTRQADGFWQVDEYEVENNRPVSCRVLFEIAGYLDRQLNKGGEV